MGTFFDRHRQYDEIDVDTVVMDYPTKIRPIHTEQDDKARSGLFPSGSTTSQSPPRRKVIILIEAYEA